MDGFYRKRIAMKKCVIIVNKELPFGLKANISAVLSMSLGKKHPELVGDDIADANGVIYEGITTIPVPILETQGDQLLIAKTLADENSDFVVVFSCSALDTKDYPAYETSLKSKNTTDVVLHGLLMYGDKEPVNKIAGKFKLLR
jgi:hypothetical protein